MAGTILAMATFMVVGLLKLSDEMSFRAKVDAKVAQIMKSRANMLINMPFSRLKEIANGKAVSGGWYEFINGEFNSTYISNPQFHFSNNSNGFPFQEPVDPISLGQTAGDFRFLLSGKPLPGDTTVRKIFPYVEVIQLQFVDDDNNTVPLNDSSLRRVNVVYTVWWVNEFIRSTVAVDPQTDLTQKVSSIAFEFAKYDPATY